MKKQVHGTREETEQKLLSIKPVQKQVQKIGKEKALSLEMLEETFHNICIRYGYVNNNIASRYELVCKTDKEGQKTDVPVDHVFYVGSITKRESPVRWIGEVYGSTLWELFANMITTVCGDIRKERKGKNDGE